MQLKYADAPYENLGVYIHALIFPKIGNNIQMEIESDELRRLLKLVSAALYQFSKGKLISLLKETPFAYLLSNFLESESSIEYLNRKFEKEKQKVVYLHQIN